MKRCNQCSQRAGHKYFYVRRGGGVRHKILCPKCLSGHERSDYFADLKELDHGVTLYTSLERLTFYEVTKALL